MIYTKKTLEKYVQLVKKIFKALQRTDISLQPDKYKFNIKEVKFLGSIIMTNRIWMNKEKVKAVREWPERKNPKEIQASLGFATFY